MATLEDRLLGEKLQYYCSSSEDEDNGDETDDNDDNTGSNDAVAAAPNYPEFNGKETSNTGPKGVLKDWQRYKQLETEERREQEREKIALAKKLQLTCRSHLDDEKAAKIDEEDVDKLIDDEILSQYIKKRMEEMMKSATTKKQFGKLYSLETSDAYLEAIENEDKNVTVVIHIYDEKISGCEALNGCLLTIMENYLDIKFCCIRAQIAKLSKKFQASGLPAILVYRGGQMIGNFLRVTNDLGEDFFATDVESFLIEHGILYENSSLQSTGRIRSSRQLENDSDSD